jgi:hypothetical protein
MMSINLSELFRQPDWPETLTQEQHEQLVREKIERARIYRFLYSDVIDQFKLENKPCLKHLY